MASLDCPSNVEYIIEKVLSAELSRFIFVDI